ncbi:MAG TPA: serine hydrolase [Herpetosiphonaceae bacterium]
MRPFHPLSACLLGLALIVPAASTATPLHGVAPSPDIAMRWAADDAPIANGDVSQTWTWGPQIFRSGAESYAEAPSQTRNVWYLDKARMEVTRPDADPDETWFVTSGLLARELISGQMQVGDAAYEAREPAAVPVAGDLDVPAEQTITYIDLRPLASLNNDQRAPSRVDYDAIVTEVVGKGGVVRQDERLLGYDVHLRAYDDVLGHNIPDVFTTALPSDQLLYIAGRPLTEPYWATVMVNRVPQDVLVQAFERRVLTYTPANPEGWRVEWGNVGRQYAQWRYGTAEDGATFDPSSALDANPTIRKLEELSPAAAQIALERSGLVGAAVLDLKSGDLYSIGGTRAFPMYSTAKVPIMVGVLNKAIREKRGVAGWEDRLLRSMIQQSSNDAATNLFIHVGGAGPLERYLRSIGIQNTNINPDGWGASTTTAQDMARLMTKLANCTILNAKLCHYALELMRGVTPGQRWGVSAGVPDGLSVAVKNGWYPEDEGWAINSVGYIKGQRKRYAIAVYTRPNPSMRYGIDTIEAISAKIYPALP